MPVIRITEIPEYHHRDSRKKEEYTMILKKALAVISTATLMFTGSAVSEMYASASVVTDVKDKLNNDFFD